MRDGGEGDDRNGGAFQSSAFKQLWGWRGWGGVQINQKERFSDYTVTGTEELREQTGNDWTKISHLITGM